ncbi:hypothetical protein D9M69_167340 [compost metagenome]
MQLHAVVDHPALQLGHRVLGHRGGRRIQRAVEEQLDAAVEEHAADLHLGLQLGELVAGGLELQQLLAERLALVAVAHGPVQRGLGQGGGADGDLQALPGQLLHQVGEALAFRAEQVLRRHADVVEEQLAGVLGLHADLLQALALAEAGHRGVHQEQADAAGAGRRIGLGHDYHHVAVHAVGDEGLGAVQHVMVAVAHGTGAHALQVGAGARLGHGDGADQLAAGHARQVGLLQVLAAVVQDVGRDDLRMQGQAEQVGRAGAGELFQHDHAVALVRAQPAVFLRHAEAEEAALPGLGPDLAIDEALFLEALVMRQDFHLQEAADRLPELQVFLVEQGARDAHWVSSRSCTRPIADGGQRNRCPPPATPPAPGGVPRRGFFALCESRKRSDPATSD